MKEAVLVVVKEINKNWKSGFMKKSWLEPHLISLLRDKKGILNSWRLQVPALSDRTKNFENWLLVETFHRALDSGEVLNIRTNGHFSDKKIKANEIKGLSGGKSKAVHLSPDISIRLKEDECIICSEVKTGLAPSEIVNDIKIVNHYKKKGICDRAEFIWVVLIPIRAAEADSSRKSFKKIFRIIRENYPEISFIQKEFSPWWILVVRVVD